MRLKALVVIFVGAITFLATCAKAFDMGLGRAAASSSRQTIRHAVDGLHESDGTAAPSNPAATPTPTPSPTPTPAPDDPPTLSNLSLSFGAFNSTTNCAGDFYFQPYNQFSDKNVLRRPFYEHGHQVIDQNGNLKPLPGFNYNVLCSSETPVKAPLDGIVTQIFTQGTVQSPDFEILIRDRASSTWFVSIDHLHGLTIALNDHVTAGQTLGVSGAFELDVGRGPVGGVQGFHDCIWNYFDASTKSTYQQDIADLESAWNTYIVANEFDPAKFGCITGKIYE